MSAGKYLVYATIVSTFVLIVWGAYLTAGNWGGACGGGSSSAISSDWPYCNGSLAIPNPAVNYGALVEYIHRTLSVVTSVLLVATLEQNDERPSAHTAHTNDLARHVDDLEPLQQVPAVLLQGVPIGPELLVDDVPQLGG